MSKDDTGCEAERAVSAYRMILLIRRFEEKAGQLYAMGLIPDEVKLCIGREALFTGVTAARIGDDPLIVGRRSHGALLALGMAPELVMRELAKPTLGLFEDPAQSPTDLSVRPKGFYRCPKPNGDRVRWAVSLAMAHSLKADHRVVFVILDGDTLDTNEIVRSLELAKRFQLPIVFIIDHATPDQHPDPTPGFGPNSALQTALLTSPVAFKSVDGIAPEKVVEACQSAANAARSGAGPQGLLISTQAFRGHASQSTTSTRGSFRQSRPDPVLQARQRLVDASDGCVDAAKAIEKDVRTTLTMIGLNLRSRFNR